MVAAPRTDADVTRFAEDLGLPGIIDLHTHFMPERVMAKVWAYFDAFTGPDGEPTWPITYRDADAEDRVERLRAMGVRRWTSMLYPHKPGMAAWLNGWAAAFAKDHPDCVHTVTFYPEEGAGDYVEEALAGGAGIAKVHLQVGAYDPRDPLLDPVWRLLAEARTPVITHAGSGPGPHTGSGPIGEVLDRHPDLTLLFAHMGGPEYREFCALALRHEHTHLDTTMAFTDFMEAASPFPPDLVEVIAAHPERIVHGSDYPNIPHTYAHQLAAYVRLGMDDEWLRAVCYDNAERLLARAVPGSLPGWSSGSA
jgi:cytosine/adenosine deaminase-related metal-dependent hydrolase